MPETRVVLSARGEAAEYSLVVQDQLVFILRNGDRFDDRQWDVRDLKVAVEHFHRTLKAEGMC